MILIVTIVIALISIEILLLVYNIGIIPKIYIAGIVVIVVSISILIEYKRKKAFYDTLRNNLVDLKEKYHVMSVPCLIINQDKTSFSKKNIQQILELI